MSIYIFALVLLFLGAFVSKKEKTGFGYIAILFLFFIAFFRAESVGIDTYNYSHYDDYKPHGVKLFEVVFLFVYKLIPVLGSRIVIHFFAIITFLFTFLACKRFKVNPTLAFFFFVLFDFYNLSLNISRQYTAAAILLYAYSYLPEEDGKKWRFFLYVILAGTIHVTSLLFGVLFLFRKINLSRISTSTILIVFLISVFFVEVVLSQFYVEWAQKALLAEEVSSYGDYFAQVETLDKASFGGRILSLGATALNVYILIRVARMKIPGASTIAMLLFFSILFNLFFEQFYGNLGRIRYDISIINIIAYSYYIKYEKSKIKPWVIITILVFFGYSYLWDLQSGSYGTVPYSFSL